MIGPDRRLKLSLLYPATTGRNFDEILRVVDSLQLTATRKVATPVDWKQGGSCMVVPGVKQEDTAGLFPKGVKVHEVPSGKVKNPNSFEWQHIFCVEISPYNTSAIIDCGN